MRNLAAEIAPINQLPALASGRHPDLATISGTPALPQVREHRANLGREAQSNRGSSAIATACAGWLDEYSVGHSPAAASRRLGWTEANCEPVGRGERVRRR